MSNIAVVCAIVIVFAIMVAGVVGVLAFTPDSNSVVVASILGTAGLILPTLIALLGKTASIEARAVETSTKVETVAAKVETVAAKVEEVHAATNGLQEKLLAATAIASHAQGVSEERERTVTAGLPPPTTEGGAAGLTTITGEPLVQDTPMP